MSYQNLEVYQLARENSNLVHEMSLKLPKFELYETGSQIRRSSKSVRSNIVEAYGRRRYKNEYIRFLIFALSSNDETLDHIESLFETRSLIDQELYHRLVKQTTLLGKKLNRFISSIEKIHESGPRAPEPRNQNLETRT
ncbi:four helix bundle protein [Fulvivirga sp. M361]|uniref:four helix bundle protein n=1 Tax=Fulvivirga sp. M361 TaxID=2594266 RepID=UPI00117A9E3B|nr:four helix bundle protein [Fulvivirga sp. M361]